MKPKTQNKLKVNQLKTGMDDGKNRHDLKEMLRLPPDEFEAIYSKALEEYATKLSATPVEHVYANFYISMLNLSKRLDIHANKTGMKDAREAINAIKAQMEIQKELVKVGLDLGVVRSGNSAAANVTANIQLIQNMNNDEIRDQMWEMAKDLAPLLNKDYNIDIMALDSQKTHYGPSALEDDPETETVQE